MWLVLVTKSISIIGMYLSFGFEMQATRDHKHTKYRDVTGLATSIPSRKSRSFYVECYGGQWNPFEPYKYSNV